MTNEEHFMIQINEKKKPLCGEAKFKTIIPFYMDGYQFENEIELYDTIMIVGIKRIKVSFWQRIFKAIFG